MPYPVNRMRRLRRSENLRKMVREVNVTVDDLIAPLFVTHGLDVKLQVPSMPGVFHYSVDALVKEARELEGLGIPAVLLFGLAASKDEMGTEAYSPDGIVQRAVRALKKAVPDLVVITDVCLCEYTDHGHCGVIKDNRDGIPDVDNDATLELLVKEALAHVRAGADMVAPSDMMDGRVAAIRNGLDGAGFHDVPLMAYSAKFASSFYGPFRDAAESPPQFGDRSSYQMDPANSDEALREVALDIAEGADMVMVKPGMPYLDIVRRVKDTFGIPTFAYQVSGEYAMIAAACDNGWLDRSRVVPEALMAFKRAGADGILTYFALEVARGLAKD